MKKWNRFSARRRCGYCLVDLVLNSWGLPTSNKRKRAPTVSTSKGKTANPRSRLSTSKGSSTTLKGKTPSSSSTPKHKAPIEIDYYDIVFKNDEHKKKYERLFTRGVVATRFCVLMPYDPYTLSMMLVGL